MDRQLKILIPILNEYNVHSILDCACETGLQTIGLKKSGYQINENCYYIAYEEKLKKRC
jgi:hypothetical protein